MSDGAICLHQPLSDLYYTSGLYCKRHKAKNILQDQVVLNFNLLYQGLARPSAIDAHLRYDGATDKDLPHG